MGLADELEKKIKDNNEALDQAAAKQMLGFNRNTQALAQAGNNAVEAIKANNAAAEQSMSNQVADIGTQLQNAENEQRDVTRLEGQRNIFGAATEFASALANLWGTSRGASNQQMKSLSQDWMRQADAARQQRRQRIDNIRERQRAAEQQLAQLKAGNGNNLANIVLANAREQAGRNDAADAMAYNNAARVAQAEQQGVQQVANLQMHENDKAASLAMNRSELNAKMLSQGFTPNDNGGYDYDPELASKLAQGQYAARYGSGVRPGGSGSSNTIPVPVPPGQASSNGIVLNINKSALDEVVNQNISGLTDLSEEDKKSIRLDIASGKTEQLYKYINKSPQLLEVLMNASVSTSPYQRTDGGSVYTVPGNEPSWFERNFGTNNTGNGSNAGRGFLDWDSKH